MKTQVPPDLATMPLQLFEALLSMPNSEGRFGPSALLTVEMVRPAAGMLTNELFVTVNVVAVGVLELTTVVPMSTGVAAVPAGLMLICGSALPESGRSTTLPDKASVTLSVSDRATRAEPTFGVNHTR